MPPQNTFVPPVAPSQPDVPPAQPQLQSAAPLTQPTFSQPQSPQPAANMQLNPAYNHDKIPTASLILGIVSLPASILSLFTLPIPTTAIVLGLVSIKRKKSFAIAGIVLGIIGIILSAIVLMVGIKLERDKKTTSSVSSHGVTGATLSSNCYSFTLPDNLSKSDVKKNSDCETILLSADNSEDLVVSSASLATTLSSSQTDIYLKNLANEVKRQASSDIVVNSSKFIVLDGVRAYQITGSENHGKYKYFGLIIALSSKDYLSVSGVKLRSFAIAYDSATVQDRLDKLAQSWHWL